MLWIIIIVVIILIVSFTVRGTSGRKGTSGRISEKLQSLDEAADWLKKFELWNKELKQLNEQQTSQFQDYLNEFKQFSEQQSKQRQQFLNDSGKFGEQQAKQFARWEEEYANIFKQENKEFDQWMNGSDQLDELGHAQLNVWMERNELLIDGSGQLNEQQGNEMEEWMRESRQLRRQRMKDFEHWAKKSKQLREYQRNEFEERIKRAATVDKKLRQITLLLADTLSIDHLARSREVTLSRNAALTAEYEAGKRKAVRLYCEAVLSDQSYPEGWPVTFAVAYVLESKLLVVQYDFPSFEFLSQPEWLSEKEINLEELYMSMIAQATLGVIHVLFTADYAEHVDSIVFNGHVTGIDPTTGHAVHPCVITLHVTRDVFTELDLARVDPEACLNGLNASVSKDPSELMAVKPLLEFNLVDPGVVNEEHSPEDLVRRTNVLDLNPRLKHEPQK